MYPSDVGRGALIQKTVEEIRYAPNRGRVFALLRTQRSIDHRKECTIDQRISVDQVQLAGKLTCHV